MTDKALILTKYGWRNIFNLEKGVEVLTLDVNTKRMEYKPITKFRETNRITLKKLYKFSNLLFKDFVTEDTYYPIYDRHDRFVDFVTAKDIYRRNIKDISHHYVPKAGIWDVPDSKYFLLKKCDVNQLKYKDLYYYYEACQEDRKLPLDEFLKFIAIYLNIGTTYYSLEYNFLVNRKKRMNKVIREILDNLNFQYEVFSHKILKTTIFLIKDPSLYLYLKGIGDCFSNYVPSELKNVSKNSLNLFLEWFKMFEAKQWMYIPSESIASVSKRLILDFNEIYLKLGQSTFIKNQDIRLNYGYFTNKIILGKDPKEYKKGIIMELKKTYVNCFFLDKRFLKIEEIKQQDWADNHNQEIIRTYSIDNENHTFYTMYNGKAHWIGHS